MNGLAEIEIQGEKVGLFYGPAISFPKIFPAFETNKAFDEKIFNEVVSVEIIYWGYQHYCVAYRQLPKFSYSQILDWVLDLKNSAQATNAIKVFNEEVRAYTKVIADSVDEKKSKSTGTKSKKRHMVS